MNAHRRTLFALCSAAALGAAVVACGGASGPGQLAIALVDAPNPGVEHIYVNITGVRAHSAQSGWTDIAMNAPAPLEVDLLALQASVLDLGLAKLPAGTVTQIRLLVAKDANNRVVVSGVESPLKVPSGYESGIKIKGPWQIASCEKATVTIDFDGLQSLTHPTGSNTEWILRPVIRVKKAESAPVACEPSEPTPPATTTPAGAGASCTLAAECLSGACNPDAKCAVGGPGTPCGRADDCASKVCTDGACGSGSAKPADGSCAVAADCLSNACDTEAGKCLPGDQGASCTSSADCYSGICGANGCITAG